VEPNALKKSRNTRQRTVILDILRQTRSHPSAEAIYREARKKLPNISLGTVYRNLGFLRDQGMVKEIRAAISAGSRFEAAIPPHAHFHCCHCDLVVDIPLPETLYDFGWERSEHISSINELELHVIGACANCAPSPVPAGV
jgi:Fe2+ or Zn2+ uptake regulation protein